MTDKQKHFIACGVIALFTLMLFACIPHGQLYGWDKGIAAILVVIAVFAKEFIWDRWMNRGVMEVTDIFWGIVGGWTMIFIWVIIETVWLTLK